LPARWSGQESTPPTKEFRVKLIRTAVMAGLAKVVYDQARKPENQQKIKEAIASFQQSRANSRPAR
jgi:hypothetical protein